MNAVLELYESTSIKNAVKSKFKQLKHSESLINNVLTQLSDKLKEKYNVTTTQYELTVKVDKRKNIDQVKLEVESFLNEIEVAFDMNYLFKVLSSSSEIIVRARRK